MLNGLKKKLGGASTVCSVISIGLLFFVCGANGANGANTGVEIINVNFDSDTPGQPPQTDSGPRSPSLVTGDPGTSILVEAYANGIATQPVVLTAQAASQYARVTKRFGDFSEGIVRVEATVAFDRLADGFFLQTFTGPPFVVVTRLIMTDSGQIQDDKTRTPVGIYAANQPFRVRMDIDMTSKTWSVAVDNEFNGFDDDPVVQNLPFENPVAMVPTITSVSADFDLFPTLSVATTAVAYDDIRVFILTGVVNIDIKPGSTKNSISPQNNGVNGVIPVAILTTETFDATTVDPTTVLFGTISAKAAPVSFALEDVDGDGDIDVILHFKHRHETDIRCGTTSAFLTGKTFGGQPIIGSDTVTTVGCK